MDHHDSRQGASLGARSREVSSTEGPNSGDHWKHHRQSPEARAEGYTLGPPEQEIVTSLPAVLRTPEENPPRAPHGTARSSVRTPGVGGPGDALQPRTPPRVKSPSYGIRNNTSDKKKEEEEEESKEEEKEKKTEKEEDEREEKEAEEEEEECSAKAEMCFPLDSTPVGDSSVEAEELRKSEKSTLTEVNGPPSQQFRKEENRDFPIDHPVFVLIDRRTRLTGKIKWTGGHFAIYGSKLAVVELEESFYEASNGKFLGESLCSTMRKRALLVEVNQLMLRPPPFYYGQRCHEFHNPEKLGTIWNTRGAEATVEWDPVDPSSDADPNIRQVAISALQGLSSSCGERCTYPLQPIAPSRLTRLIGKHRGIQGDSNSCYLDTTLFCLFAFTSFWERQMDGSPRRDRDTVLHHVVFPLRANGFVPARNVREVRQMLCRVTRREEFASQSRDLPETLEALLGKALQVKPMVMTSSLGRDGVSFPASFSIETMPPPKQPKVCSSQHFLESSAVTMEFQLTAVPKCLILLLPRERGYFMKEVIPALELDLEPVLEGLKLCYICGQVADTQCPQSMVNCSAASTFFCSGCLELENVGGTSDGVPLRKIPLKPAAPRKENCRMRLSAVICISHSHYNCFARCGDTWVFFDSMSDREVFGGNQICVPRIRRAKLDNWVRQKLAGNPGIKDQDDRDICDRAFSSPYALIYDAPEC